MDTPDPRSSTPRPLHPLAKEMAGSPRVGRRNGMGYIPTGTGALCRIHLPIRNLWPSSIYVHRRACRNRQSGHCVCRQWYQYTANSQAIISLVILSVNTYYLVGNCTVAHSLYQEYNKYYAHYKYAQNTTYKEVRKC